MARRRRRRSSRTGGLMMDMIGVGIASSIISGSGATGPTKAALDVVPAMMVVGALDNYSRRRKSYWL